MSLAVAVGRFCFHNCKFASPSVRGIDQVARCVVNETLGRETFAKLRVTDQMCRIGQSGTFLVLCFHPLIFSNLLFRCLVSPARSCLPANRPCLISPHSALDRTRWTESLDVDSHVSMLDSLTALRLIWRVRISALPARLFVARCTGACRSPRSPWMSSVWLRSACNR